MEYLNGFTAFHNYNNCCYTKPFTTLNFKLKSELMAHWI